MIGRVFHGVLGKSGQFPQSESRLTQVDSTLLRVQLLDEALQLTH
jgi:hypothetical protein